MNRYSKYSPIMVTTDGVKYRPGLSFVDYQFDGNIKFHQVQPEEVGRLDLIAYQHYRDCSLFWVIALFNNIADPIDEVTVGKHLAIPVGRILEADIKPSTYRD